MDSGRVRTWGFSALLASFAIVGCGEENASSGLEVTSDAGAEQPASDETEQAVTALRLDDRFLCSNRAPMTVPPDNEAARILTATTIRVEEAICDARVPPGINRSNGDIARYPDRCGAYTKGLPHDVYGRVGMAAFATLAKALKTGRFVDFERVILGGVRTLNNPLAGLAYDLEGLNDRPRFGDSRSRRGLKS